MIEFFKQLFLGTETPCAGCPHMEDVMHEVRNLATRVDALTDEAKGTNSILMQLLEQRTPPMGTMRP